MPARGLGRREGEAPDWDRCRTDFQRFRVLYHRLPKLELQRERQKRKRSRVTQRKRVVQGKRVVQRKWVVQRERVVQRKRVVEGKRVIEGKRIIQRRLRQGRFGQGWGR